MKSSYIPTDRFIQICASPFPQDAVVELHALDENGTVWQFIREHQVWIPLPRNRAEITPASSHVHEGGFKSLERD